MRIVVIGGSGLVGSKLVRVLRDMDHDVVAASPSLGVNAFTGEGLRRAMAGAQAVVDVTNAPVLDDRVVLDFFEASGQNLIAAEAAEGIGHHVTLSVMGVGRLWSSAYFSAKARQEELIRRSSIPFTIVRSMPFFESIDRIVQSGADGDVVRVPPIPMQPIASDDVAALLADIAVAAPKHGIVELVGPEAISLVELARQVLVAHQDPRDVIPDAGARFFGAELDGQSLVPGPNPRVGTGLFRDWLRDFISAD